MSDRPIIKQYTSIAAGSMAGNLTGNPSIILRLGTMSYSFSWSGSSPVGTVSVQVSNDYSEGPNGSVMNAGTWNTIPLVEGGTQVTSVALSGNSGNGYIDLGILGGYAVRPVYTAGSGTGTLTAIYEAKVI